MRTSAENEAIAEAAGEIAEVTAEVAVAVPAEVEIEADRAAVVAADRSTAARDRAAEVADRSTVALALAAVVVARSARGGRSISASRGIVEDRVEAAMSAAVIVAATGALAAAARKGRGSRVREMTAAASLRAAVSPAATDHVFPVIAVGVRGIRGASGCAVIADRDGAIPTAAATWAAVVALRAAALLLRAIARGSGCAIGATAAATERRVTRAAALGVIGGRIACETAVVGAMAPQAALLDLATRLANVCAIVAGIAVPARATSRATVAEIAAGAATRPAIAVAIVAPPKVTWWASATVTAEVVIVTEMIVAVTAVTVMASAAPSVIVVAIATATAIVTVFVTLAAIC